MNEPLHQDGQAEITQFESRWRILVTVQFVAFFLVGLYATWVQRYLYGDGSHFFLVLLRDRRVLDFDAPRHFTHLLTQFPVVYLLQNLQCRDIKIAAAVYGGTQILLPLVGILVTLWAARRARADYLLYPLTSSAIIYLDVSFFSISESLFAASLFFPMLYLLVFSEKLNLVRSLVLVALAVCATRSYETYLFLAWPLVFAAARRGWISWTKRTYGEVLICSVCGSLFLTAFWIAAYSVIFPGNANSRNGLAMAVLLHLIYPPVWFSLLMLVSVLWCLFLPDRQLGWQRLRNATCGCGILIMLLPLVGVVVPPLQYTSRIQCIYVPLLLGSIVIWKEMRATSIASLRPARHKELWLLAAGACLVATTFQFEATARWDGYRRILLRELGEHQGLIAFKASNAYLSILEGKFGNEGEPTLWEEFIANPPKIWKQLKIAQFDWGWALPSLSVSLSALNLDSISSIICAPETDDWQPFDPHKIELIPDLRDFGIPTNLTPSR